MPRPNSVTTTVTPPATSEALVFLHKINHVQLEDFRKIDGVKYYVLNVYEKAPMRGMTHRLGRPLSAVSPPPPVNTVIPKHKPSYRIVKRFRDFEELRKQLQRSFSSSHKMGNCSCCDAFTTYLSCASMQPSLLMRLTKREADRKQLLQQYINQVIRLAVMETGRGTHHLANEACCVKDTIPQVLEHFIRSSPEEKTRKLMENDESPAAVTA